MSDSETPSGLRKALSVGPNTMIHLKLGTLYGIAGALVTAAGFIWGIKAKVDQTYEAVAALSSKVEKPIEHIAVLWDEHERTALWRRSQDKQ